MRRVTLTDKAVDLKSFSDVSVTLCLSAQSDLDLQIN